MKEYFISEIDIEKLYHLSDIKIKLDNYKIDVSYKTVEEVVNEIMKVGVKND